jgi:2-C-methyl-D-erythritol 4-phosphate cytidylyltransferase
MGGAKPKQYQSLLGKPVLLRTLQRIASHPKVGGVVVVLAASDPHWPGLVMCEGKPVMTATGGEARAHSVKAGLDLLAPFVPEEDFVLVHDAARPAVRHSDIDRLIDVGTRHEVGAILALPVADTLKQAGAEGVIEATVPRENLWRALTPQLFRLGQLRAALDRALGPGGAPEFPTDEANALEVVGRMPLLVEAAADNLKVTRVQDLALMEAILQAQGERR